MANFQEVFIDNIDFNFEISQRSSIRLDKIKTKISEKKELIPLIVDISINGYTQSQNFDFEAGGHKWSEYKDQFKSGEEAQTDPEALTVKRAIRLCAGMTSDYIENKNIDPPLSRHNPKLDKRLCHLGAHFIVTKEHVKDLLTLWHNFDSWKQTKIESSVRRILEIRFPDLFPKEEVDFDLDV